MRLDKYIYMIVFGLCEQNLQTSEVSVRVCSRCCIRCSTCLHAYTRHGHVQGEGKSRARDPRATHPYRLLALAKRHSGEKAGTNDRGKGGRT
jgi:hypothetical protein